MTNLLRFRGRAPVQVPPDAFDRLVMRASRLRDALDRTGFEDNGAAFVAAFVLANKDDDGPAVLQLCKAFAAAVAEYQRAILEDHGNGAPESGGP